jgi:hypothetical protein
VKKITPDVEFSDPGVRCSDTSPPDPDTSPPDPKTENRAPTTGAERPRDWLKLFETARIHGRSLEPLQRARWARLKARAAAAYFAAETRRDYEDYRERQAQWMALQRRADDHDDGRHARPHIVAALIERDGGFEAKVAWLAPGLAATWPGVTEIDLARRGLNAAARAEVARLEAARDAWGRGRAEDLIRRAAGGDVQAIFRVFPQDLAQELAGALPALCAYLADCEDFPEEV